MTTKELGKITFAEFGTIRDYPFLIGLQLGFRMDGSAVMDGGLWWLGKSIELLAQADVAYFVKGWNKARGCLIENECAFRYGVKTIRE